MNKSTTIFIFCFLHLNFIWISCHQSTSDKKFSAYLFTYFTGNGPGEEAIHFAVSLDGTKFRALNGNQPVFDSKSHSTTGGLRDPHILRSASGDSFYMVATDLYVPDMCWRNYAMVLLKSADLIHWESSMVNIPEAFPDDFGDVWRVWAPQVIYDDNAGKYMIYFSMKQDDDPDKIYYAYANKEFSGLESKPEQLYFSPTYNACIDGDILFFQGKYHLFMKSESGDPGIKLAMSDSLTSGYELVSHERVDKETHRVEGSGIFKLNNSENWILMYDVYTQGRYQFTKSNNLQEFSIINEQISMDFHPRHGTVMPITENELISLVREWGNFDHPLIEPTSPLLKKQNVDIRGPERWIYLPVDKTADLSHFDPGFVSFPGIKLSPPGPRDFSSGSVQYSMTIDGLGTQSYMAHVSKPNNPVLEGYYADPEILYSEKTGKFYIYPTSDGFHNWSGDYFKVFSSDNLVDWDDEGIILDLNKDVSWADRNAWAPCIIEKKTGTDQYKYYYYFTAAQKIGVAVADHPAGPFVDMGKALIDWKPQGISGGQEIDPDVFTDTVTGKDYLYWGNGYMAGAELNEDMVSINRETQQIMTPDTTYREGTCVFYRNGTYYFMWSENDTRSPEYNVRYGTSSQPFGQLTIPDSNVVIARDEVRQIFATGHNSIIQIPGKDEWYLVYHRFTYPKGVGMGRRGGFHREICIDRLEFDEEGKVIRVDPTFEGIAPVAF